MTTPATTSLVNTFSGLKSDLSYAWETRNEVAVGMEFTEETCPLKRALNAKNFINSIDPENMAALQAFFKFYGAGTDSLLSFALKIVNGYTPELS